jgi:hypothetical protein
MLCDNNTRYRICLPLILQHWTPGSPSILHNQMIPLIKTRGAIAVLSWRGFLAEMGNFPTTVPAKGKKVASWPEITQIGRNKGTVPVQRCTRVQ